MKMRNLLLLFVATMLLTMLFGYTVFASETIKACPQADGSTLYTNKDVKVCEDVELPELSIVPDRKAQFTLDAPVIQVSPTEQSDEVCTLFTEWVQLNMDMPTRFLFNPRYTNLARIFGGGFVPTYCK